MPISGGSSDKLGNRFEARWTVYQLAEILNEKSDSIRLEPPADEGFEFFVRKGEVTEYHQVKRQDTCEGRWMLSSLQSRGVLEKFYDKLNNPTSHCVFVSTHAAHQLEELAENARQASNLNEFKNIFLGKTDRKKHFESLCLYWHKCSGEEGFHRLKRVFVKTIGETELRELVESKIFPLVEGEKPKDVASFLFEYVLDEVHHELIAADLWRYLERKQCRRRQWAKDPHVLAAVESQNNRYIGGLLKDTVLGISILREEAKQAVDQLKTQTGAKAGIILTGQAGVGKSTVIPQIIEPLKNEGWQVLAFRVDRLEPRIAPEQVGEDLLLPASPAHVLASIAKDRDCVLVIDQIDAVSLASGRNPQFFETINEIIEQTVAYPKMRLILGCRKFDVDNDHRFKQMVEENPSIQEIPVKNLSLDNVREVLGKLKINSGMLSQKQLELLTIPLHLSLLAEISHGVGNKELSLDFKTSNELFSKFWDRKRMLISERLKREVNWTKVIDRLCDHMSEYQVLSVPAILFDEDDVASDIKAMASERVLSFDRGVYSFFHERFFDYTFARRFASGKERIAPFLLKSEQHLFRRGQVRQILLNEREYFFERYLDDLNQLIFDEKIRLHLKSTVLALLKNLEDPKNEEFQIILPIILDSQHLWTNEAWQLIWTAPWFRLVDSLGYIRNWLSSDNEWLVNQTVNAARIVQRLEPDRVAELLEPFVGRSDEWNNRLFFVMQWANLHEGRGFLDLFLKCLDTGILDNARGPIAVNSDFWDLLYGLAKKRPDWAAEVIGHYCGRILIIAKSSSGKEDAKITLLSLLNNARDGHRDYFLDAALGAPLAFVEQVLPFMLQAMQLATYNSRKRLDMDSIWFYRNVSSEYGNIKEFLLEGMVEAFSLVAKTDVDSFRNYSRLLQKTNFETAQYLLVRAYAANTVLADEAIEFLCENTARLEAGYSGNDYWAARELIQAATEHCSSKALPPLEKVLLSYYPDWEKTKDGHKALGFAQFTLLGGISESRRSKQVQLRLGEWQRKFKQETVAEPMGVEVGFVESPIVSNAMDKMTDEQWLSAIYEYNDDGHFNFSKGGFKGGSLQLSREFEGKLKQDPVRFGNLACKFDKDVNPVFFEAALRGIEVATVGKEMAMKLCRHCHALPHHPVGRWLAPVVARFADEALSDEDIEMVAWYATDAPDPQGELWETEAASGDYFYGGDIDTTSINSVRGVACGAVGHLIFHDKSRMEKLLPVLEKMVADLTITVRAAVALALVNVLKHDRDLAVRLFLKLCDTRDELLRARGVERFLKYALQTHYTALIPILERMINSGDENTQTAAARLVCMTGLVLEEAHELAEACTRHNQEALRIGAAQVFAANLLESTFKNFCVGKLCSLFNDESERVREEASACFRKLRNNELIDFLNLADCFVKSEAFANEHQLLFYALEESATPLPELSILAFERFFEVEGSGVSDVRTRAAADSYQVSKLLLRLYAQSKESHIQKRCLNLIDDLSRIGAMGLKEAIEDFER